MSNLNLQAQALVDYVSAALDNTFNFGHVTNMVYETAWVSLVRSPVDPYSLLFPECNKYVLDQQMADGGWQSSPVDIDGIINTLGGLLALKRNQSAANFGLSPQFLGERVARASQFLAAKLQSWDVSTCEHVGFEIIVPSMLEQLEKYGIHFEFPGQHLLLSLNKKKIEKIPASVWTGTVQTTVIHSLEAFVGKASFAGLKGQLVDGSMGVSPAASAAYLINSEQWDMEVENYLRRVIDSKIGVKGEFGGVPDMYSSTGFEVLWIAATLLENGFLPQNLPGIETVIDITQEFYDSMNGLMGGFSKLNVPDADDTAKSIVVRSLLGLQTDPDNLIAAFEGKSHFLTYLLERHPSVTTNCNVLSALLEASEPSRYKSQIEKTASFVCESWTRADSFFKDKWHMSEFYPIMLMVESLVRLTKKWDEGKLDNISTELLHSRIPLILCQALNQTLYKQNMDGSWGLGKSSSREITSYAIITLSNLASLPFLGDEVQAEIDRAVKAGRDYVTGAPDFVEHIWIGKSNYSPINVSRAYVLAGLRANIPKYSLSPKLRKAIGLDIVSMDSQVRHFSTLKMLSCCSVGTLYASVIEGHLFLKQLKLDRIDMFPRAGMQNDTYMDFIPVGFVIANNLRGTFLKSAVLYQLMVLVLRTYQIDEYVEFVLAKKFRFALGRLRTIIDTIFEAEEVPVEMSCPQGSSVASVQKSSQVNMLQHEKTMQYNGGQDGKPDEVLSESDFDEVQSKLQAFVHCVLHNLTIQNSTRRDRIILAYALQDCVRAQIDSIGHNAQGCDPVPSGSYYEWVNGTAASHSCAPIVLIYLRCILKSPLTRIGRSADYEFIVQDLWRHLSTKCRIENDIGSFNRDREERNLNSFDFPEFAGNNPEDTKASMIKDHTGLGFKTQVMQERGKEELRRILSYERRCIDAGIRDLEHIVGSNKGLGSYTAREDTLELESLKFFLTLSDIWGELYEMRDLSCKATADLIA